MTVLELHGRLDFWGRERTAYSRKEYRDKQLCPLCFIEGWLEEIAGDSTCCARHSNQWRAIQGWPLSLRVTLMCYIVSRAEEAAQEAEDDDPDLAQQFRDMIAFGVRNN
jgi:hypothetical protein